VNARPIHRFISFLIDLVITGSFGFLLGYPAIIALFETLAVRSTSNIYNLFYTTIIVMPIITIVAISYYLVLPLLWKRQTIGRFLTRIAIVKDDGTPVDFPTLFLREVIGRMLGGFMSLGLTLLVEAVLIKQSRRRSFADALSHTKVIDI
jgi:uncharacterized RDD family membrane protein YckC